MPKESKMGVLEKIKERIYREVGEAAWSARREGKLAFDTLPEYALEVPRDSKHGDLATNIAMMLAGETKRPPRAVAEALIPYFRAADCRVERIEIAGPGFINFFLDPAWIYAVLPEVLAEDEDYGCSSVGGGERVQVEFVSANPTGLLHMGNARGAALGDTLANLLAAAGYQVRREFYINDAGNQIETFGRSLEARYLQLLGREVVFPEDGYPGQDLVENVRHLIDQVGESYLSLAPEIRRRRLVKEILQVKLNQMKSDLERFGVRYDVWFSEQTLHQSGKIGAVLQELKDQGYLYEAEGAVWFRSTLFGDEKDEVLVRSNGTPTYFAADIAYHQNKFQRGFERVINIWGADHHGHILRLKGAMKALGYNPDQLQVIIMQLVRLFKGNEPVRMSKRSGEYITLRELIDDVGRDAARYFFILRNADSHLDFDLDLAKKESNENPVYYIQYAHARICSILRNAGELPPPGEVAAELLQDPTEVALIKKIAELPGEIAFDAQQLEPHRIAHYAYELATLFHAFYTNCRVLTEEKGLREARLLLIAACRIALRNTLRICGVSAPERM